MPNWPATGSFNWDASLKKVIAPYFGGPTNSTRGAYAASVLLTASGSAQVVGYDAVDNLLIVADQNSLHTSADHGVTLSADKGLPIVGSNYGLAVSKIVRFGSLWVALVADPGASYIAKVLTSPAPGAGGSCTWTLRQTLTTGSSGLFSPCLATDGTQVIVGEYGDPVVTATPTPHIWRSTNGTSYSIVYTASGAPYRHIHAVYPDSYTANTWWMTLGDGPSPCVFQSTNGGVTWTGITAFDASHQVVQISDDANNVYLAVDTTFEGLAADMYVLKKSDLTVVNIGHVGCHTQLPVPRPGQYSTGFITSGAAFLDDFTNSAFAGVHKGCKITGAGIPDGTTISSVGSSTRVTMSANATATSGPIPYQVHGLAEQWMSDPFFGVIDPATGIYYFCTVGDSTGLANTHRGLFMIPYPGGPVVTLDQLDAPPRGMFIAGGYLFCGNKVRPLITVNS